MFDGFFQAMACVGDPVGCGIGWLDGLPILIVITASAALGMLAGAHMGKVAVYAVLTLGGAMLFIGRRSADDPVEVEDGPPVRRRSSRKPPPGKRVRTIFDMFGKK